MAHSGAQDEDPVRAYIEDWPYASHYLQSTLDPALIAHHGRALLLRSLNNGRLVCFVGSGVSMAYGRLGWGDMVQAMEKELNPRPTELSPSSTATEPVSHPMLAELRGWLRELNLGKRSGGDDLHSGRYPAAFQFLEQIEELLRTLGNTQRPTLRDKVRIQLFDDRGHAFHLIRDLQADLEKIDQPGNGELPVMNDEMREQAARDLVELPSDAKDLRRDAIYPTKNQQAETSWRDRFLIDLGVLAAR